MIQQPIRRPTQPTESERVLHLIALNAPHHGNIKGVRGADLACYQQARQALFTTTFRAFISSNVQDLQRIVHYGDHETPVVNLAGERISDTWRGLFDEGTMKNVPIFSFNRRNIGEDALWPDKLVWHGSNSKGERDEHCEAWRSADGAHRGSASEFLGGLSWFANTQSRPCSQHLAVLCIEYMSKFHVDKRLAKENLHGPD